MGKMSWIKGETELEREICRRKAAEDLLLRYMDLYFNGLKSIREQEKKILCMAADCKYCKNNACIREYVVIEKNGGCGSCELK